MPVSYQHKLIYIHIPKCGGTTIESILKINSTEGFFSYYKTIDTGIIVEKNKFCNLVDYNNCINKTPQHFTYRELKRVLPKVVFEKYNKFAIVRNPYSRLVSDYYFIKNYLKLKDYTFEQLVNQLALVQEERVDKFDGHLEPQYTYLVDDDNIIKNVKIFYYEEIGKCFEFLKGVINFTEIPHLRKTVYTKPYQEYYTSDLQEKVYNFYKEDFLQFNYKFNL